LQVTFIDEIVTPDGGAAQSHQSTRDILGNPPDGFSILPCDNHLNLVADEFAAVLSPFFFCDDQNTFFVEPSLEEVTTEEWEDWVIPVPRHDPDHYGPAWFNAIPLEPVAPVKVLPPSVDPGVIDPAARFTFRERADWVTSRATAVQLGSTIVGAQGGLGAASPTAAAGATVATSAPGTAAAATSGTVISRLADTRVAEGVMTVGAGGLNVANLQRLAGLRG
jgi:hypothetical protein